MDGVFEQIKKIKVVPVVKVNSLDEAENLACALIKGNLPIAEITLRTDCALDAIKNTAEKHPEIIVGAGTVLNYKQAKDAIKAGAKFIVSPGLNLKVLKTCKKAGVLYIPGCVTPTEITTAIENGITTVKFFPANVYGGLTAIKALAGPFSGVTFMPTSGINGDNLAEFLAFDKIVACGGSWMVDANLIKNGEYGKIESLCRKARETADSVNK